MRELKMSLENGNFSCTMCGDAVGLVKVINFVCSKRENFVNFFFEVWRKRNNDVSLESLKGMTSTKTSFIIQQDENELVSSVTGVWCVLVDMGVYAMKNHPQFGKLVEAVVVDSYINKLAFKLDKMLDGEINKLTTLDKDQQDMEELIQKYKDGEV